MLSLEQYVNMKINGLENVDKVKLGIKHIIADVISKNLQVRSLLNEM